MYIYLVTRVSFCFKGFKSHKLHDPLEEPGTADLTADVDFFFLRRCLNPNTSQSKSITSYYYIQFNYVILLYSTIIIIFYFTIHCIDGTLRYVSSLRAWSRSTTALSQTVTGVLQFESVDVREGDLAVQ